MTNLPRIRPVSSLGLTLLLSAAPLALSACNTEDIAPHQLAICTDQTDPGQGSLAIVFDSTDPTYAENQARLTTNPNLTEYHIFVDGREVVYEAGGSSSPVIALEGSLT